MFKEIVVFLCNGILCNKKKGIIYTTKNMDESPIHYAERKKLDKNS